MIEHKLDAAQIRNFLQDLASQSWLKREERSWWPWFVFHYTDVRNATKILQEGCLHCRSYLEETHQLTTDSGSPLVLAGTATPTKQYVRLYFRPKTPTQYHAEGIRTPDRITPLHAHCPVPIFFLFSSIEILMRADCLFSDGNLASQHARLLSNAVDLASLPWAKIYHTGPFDPHQDSDITFRRNAEVIVPQKLDLASLSFIYCRSAAEKETLLSLLSPKLRQQYQETIVATTRSMLFFRAHTFIETVDLSANHAVARFSPDTQSPGPFRLRVTLDDYHMIREDFYVTNDLKIDFPRTLPHYTIQIELDEYLAYANSYSSTLMDAPF